MASLVKPFICIGAFQDNEIARMICDAGRDDSSEATGRAKMEISAACLFQLSK